MTSPHDWHRMLAFFSWRFSDLHHNCKGWDYLFLTFFRFLSGFRDKDVAARVPAEDWTAAPRNCCQETEGTTEWHVAKGVTAGAKHVDCRSEYHIILCRHGPSTIVTHHFAHTFDYLLCSKDLYTWYSQTVTNIQAAKSWEQSSKNFRWVLIDASLPWPSSATPQGWLSPSHISPSGTACAQRAWSHCPWLQIKSESSWQAAQKTKGPKSDPEYKYGPKWQAIMQEQIKR